MEYCGRCDRDFISDTALDQHIRDSARHAVCGRCNADFSSRSSLEQHRRDSHRHNICAPCNLDFFTESDLDDHDEDVHHMCRVCRRFFSSHSNLQHHRMTHAEKVVECFGCTRRFISTAAMILHLEAGTCESGASRYIVEKVARQGSWHFTSSHPDFEFDCPRCPRPFRLMSGLLQHFQSGSCQDGGEECRPLSNYLRRLEYEF